MNLTIETAGTQEKAEEGLAAAMKMKVEEYEGSEDEEVGGGTQGELEALELLTKES